MKRSLVLAVLALVCALVVAPAAMAEDEALVEIHLRTAAQVAELVDRGIDLAEYSRSNPDGTTTLNAYLTPSEQAALAADGFAIGATIEDVHTWRLRLQERAETLAKLAASQASGKSSFRAQSSATVRMMRADYFTNYAGQFLSVEAKAAPSSSVTMTMQWDSGPGTAMGSGGSATMSNFTDAGQYQYHRVLVRVSTRPDKVQVTSSAGGAGTLAVKEWLPDGPKPPVGYQQDFITHYMDPTEVYAAIEALAQEDERSGADIVEIVELPYKTNGYRRKAQALLGVANVPGSALVATSEAFGHQGGNDLSIALLATGAAGTPPTVAYEPTTKLVTVSFAQGTTAAQLAAAFNANPVANSLMRLATYRGNVGTGAVTSFPPTRLDDGLDAPATVSREPWTVRAIRIGKQRDGSKVGVMAYHQEHAREWVTPLVAVETAYRLVRNYATDPLTKELVDNLDIFIIPSVNPDGAHYSFYDFASQRRNLVNHCGASRNDPGSWDVVGVDINRNYQIGSIFDGYSGASSSCTSDVYSGPAEHSESESKNVQWLADAFPNIKFSMNTHTYGGYFMWSPGSYKTPGRITLPAPNIGIESYFFAAADIILQRIKAHRNTVVLPGRTGPIADVLYSAAGNSADELWYRKGIIAYSFEAGADRFVPAPTGTTQQAVGFMPEYNTEGHDEALEFAAGTIGLFEAALLYSRDRQAPTATLVPGPHASKTPISVRFQSSEPAVIYYTLDGSAPTFESKQYESQGRREPGETLTFTQTTTVRWFARDIAGNASEIRSARYAVDAVAPVTTAAVAPEARNGWHARPSTVTLTADDGADGAGIALTEYRLDGSAWTPYLGPFAVEGDGEHVLEYRSVDEAGNAEGAKTLAFKADLTLPQVALASPSNGQVYLIGAGATASYSCSDTPSGVASCTGPVANGAAIATGTVGFHPFAVTATDVAGNSATATATYQVVWPFTGFHSPVAAEPALNEAQSGSAVPLKFSLGGDRGRDVLAAGSPTTTPVSCSTRAPVGAAEPTAATTGLSFASGVYTYDWKTDKAWAGTCRQVVLKLRDGTSHRASFSFK